MKISNQGRKQLKMREGERLNAYQDTAGIWTIGVGHVSPWVRKGITIDQYESDRLFSADIAWAEESITENVRVNLTQNQFDTLVSFVFNIGETAFRNSTLLRELNKGNYWAVPSQLMRWNKITVNNRKVTSRGLKKRRASEISQWNDVVAACPTCSVTPAEPEGRKPMALMAKSKTAQAGTTVVAASGYSFITDLIHKAQELQTNLMSVLPDSNMVYVAMIGVGAFIIYNRYSDSRKGRAY